MSSHPTPEGNVEMKPEGIWPCPLTRCPENMTQERAPCTLQPRFVAVGKRVVVWRLDEQKSPFSVLTANLLLRVNVVSRSFNTNEA